MDAALYAIYVASSTEWITSPVECNNRIPCKDGDQIHTTQHTYNSKSVLDLTKLTEEYKTRYDTMLKLKNDTKGMLKYINGVHDDLFESSFTHNIYHVSSPSVLRGIETFKLIDFEDPVSQMSASRAMLFSEIYICTGETDEDGNWEYYEPITDPAEFFQIMHTMTEN